MGESPWLEHAVDFGDRHFRIPHVLEHRVTLDAAEDAVAKRQPLDIRNHVNTGQTEQVEVDIALRASARPADVQIPAPERRLDAKLFGVVKERSRRPQPARYGQSVGGYYNPRVLSQRAAAVVMRKSNRAAILAV